MNGQAGYSRNKKDYFNLSLEKPTFLSNFIDKYLVSGFLNTFPKAGTWLFSKSKGEFARLLFSNDCEKFSFRLFEEMYKYSENGEKGDLLNVLIMESPAIKAARNRKKISKYILKNELETFNKSPILVASIGGGNGRLELEVLSKVKRDDIYYCCIDGDPFAEQEFKKNTGKYYGNRTLFVEQVVKPGEMSSLKQTIEKANKTFNRNFKSFDISLCLGVVEYMDLNSCSNKELGYFLNGLRNYTSKNGRILLDETDFHDRVKYIEQGLNWHMRLRGKKEIRQEVEKSGWNILYCEKEPMNIITIILGKNS